MARLRTGIHTHPEPGERVGSQTPAPTDPPGTVVTPTSMKGGPILGDVMMKIWASWEEPDRVREGDPLTRLRGVCPECGNRFLHLYSHGDVPGYQVFLHCECGYGGFADRDDWVVRSARPFRSSMFANSWFRGYARTRISCPTCCGKLVLLDTPDPNLANEVCGRCGRFEVIHAPIEVEQRTEASPKAGIVLQFRSKSQIGASCS